MRDILFEKITNIGIAAAAWAPRRALLAAARNPKAAQENLLRRLMEKNAETDFGKKHGFSGVKTMADYRKAVPLQDYDSLLPYIERQDLTGEPCLTAENPVFFICTSGTTGKPKNIPVTPSGAKHFKSVHKITSHTYGQVPGVFRGKFFSLNEAAVMGRMPGGAPFGSASGVIYASASKFVRAKYLIPDEVLAIEDYKVRARIIAALATAEENITCAVSAFPPAIEAILKIINTEFTGIIEALKTGGPLPGVPGDMVPGEGGIVIDPARARALEAKFAAQGRLDFKDLWPNIKGLATWTAGSAGAALDRLRPSFPNSCRALEIGYVASEVRGAVNINARTNVCMPCVEDVLFEFVERGAHESGAQDFLSLHELEINKEYFVFITTHDGLYRYAMNDIIRVTDFTGATPSFTFVQKGGGVTNISGEKIYESQIIKAAPEAFTEHGVKCSFYILLADHDKSAYRLYAEPAEPPADGSAEGVRESADAKLQAMNIAYRAMRGNGALQPLEFSWLRPGAEDAHRSFRMKTGKNFSQLKYIHVQNADEFAFPLHEWAAA